MIAPHAQHCILWLAASHRGPVLCAQFLLFVDHCGDTVHDWTTFYIILTSFPNLAMALGYCVFWKHVLEVKDLDGVCSWLQECKLN